MRSQVEVEALRKEVDDLIDKLNEFDLPAHVQEQNEQLHRYLNDVGDALIWVLGEITTDDFRSDNMLRLEYLRGLFGSNRVNETSEGKRQD